MAQESISEPRIMLVCYIVDEVGEYLDYKDYASKGVTLKIETEELHQEVVPSGLKYDQSYYPKQIELFPTILTTPDFPLSDPVERLAHIVEATAPENLPVTAYSYKSNDFSTNYLSDNYLPPSTRNYSMLMNRHSVVQDELEELTLEPMSTGETDGIVYQTLYKGTIYRDTWPTPTPLNYDRPEGPLVIVAEPEPAVRVIVVACSIFETTYEFTEPDNVEIGTPESYRTTEPSEMYSKRLPTWRQRVTPEEGLVKAYDDLLATGIVDRYKLDKVIIGPNAKLEFDDFPEDKYDMSNALLMKLFKNFKFIEIRNSLLTVTMPAGDYDLHSLKIYHSRVKFDNTNIKAAEAMVLEGCEIDKVGDSSVSSITCDAEFGLKDCKWVGASRLSVITKAAGDVMISGVSFETNHTAKADGPLLSLFGFASAKLQDLTFKTGNVLTNMGLIGLYRCKDILVTNIDFGTGRDTSKPDMFIEGGLNITMSGLKSIDDKSTSNLINITKVDVGCKLKISDSEIFRKNFLKIVDATIPKLTLSNCTINADKLLTTPMSVIGKLTINKGKYNLADAGEFELLKGAASDATFVFGTPTTIMVDEKFSFTKCIIITDHNLTFKYMNDKAAITSTDTTYSVKGELSYEPNYTPGTDESETNKLTFTAGRLDHGTFKVFHTNAIIMKYFKFNSSKVKFDEIGSISFLDVESNKVSAFDFNKVDLIKKSTMTVTKDLSIKAYGMITSNLTITPTAPISIKFNGTDSTTKLSIEDGEPTKLNITSDNMTSSAFIIKDNSDITVDMRSPDMSMYKSIDEDFDLSRVGKRIIENIWYGKLL